MTGQKSRFVGQNISRVDGVEKVTGKARFTGDLEMPGMLYGRILRSPHPHARILNINTSEAEALPGVIAVLTADDISDTDPYYNGRPVIAIQKVHYVGEPLAAVAAQDLDIAEAALSLISVDFEELPAALGLEGALKEGAPLVHESLSSNICCHKHLEKGDIQRGFAESDAIFEDTFHFPMVYHYALEPHAVIAKFDDEGISVWASAQHPFQVRADLAKVFRLELNRVRLVIPYLGGGFGSKSFTKFEPLVVALARKTAGRPVKICNSVTESMLTVRRHAAKIRIKTGVKKDGRLWAREAEIYLDTGGYEDNGPLVAMRAATRILSPYRTPHISSHAYAVYTNSSSGGSFRAIAAPQALFAAESQMDRIASSLRMDPATLRFNNFLDPGEELCPDLRGMDADLSSSLKKLVLESHFMDRPKGTAIGLACGATNAGANPVSEASVHLQGDGSLEVRAGSTEMGQGVRTILSQIIADELSLPLESVHIGGADTRVTPYDSSTGSSRSTTIMGLAVQRAGRDLKDQLLKIGADILGVKPGQVELSAGTLICGSDRLSLRELLEKGPGQKTELVGRGEVGPEITDTLPVFWEIGLGCAEVGVDAQTGEILLKSYFSLADVGRAINPEQCIGQEEGAAMMGIGHTLFEEMVYEGGELLNPNLVDYRVPTFADLPGEFHSLLVENADGPGPHGARGMGEGGVVGVAPAIANALFRGFGIQVKELPMTPERIWRALREKPGHE